MLEWLGPEADAMRVAFSRVFGSRLAPFGSPAAKVGGLSDDEEGVQWTAGYDPRDGRQWVGVNLEGMQYDDWPVARLIGRELREPRLFVLLREHPGLASVRLLWRRDYWQPMARPEIEEGFIGPTPIALGDLSPEGWRASLDEASGCLNARRRLRGRATQVVTLDGGEQVEGEVSPRLTFEYEAGGRMAWETLFAEARARMQPLHEWTVRRAREPARF